jgi:ribonuclease Z
VHKIIILGTASAVPDENHENTHMVVTGREQNILIDCVGNDLVRFEKLGISFHRLTDMILTHFHPDHVSGVPSLLMDMWLLGRTQPINIYGLGYTTERMKKVMEFYDWDSWPHFFPVNFYPLPETEMAIVMDTDEFRIYSSPVHHLVPTIGLRLEFKETGKTLAYSCDTEPCSEVKRLASGADVLIHEASGATLGHTSSSQAGAVASDANARSLYLIHYPTRGSDLKSLVADAQSTFTGKVVLTEDLMEFKL